MARSSGEKKPDGCRSEVPNRTRASLFGGHGYNDSAYPITQRLHWECAEELKMDVFKKQIRPRLFYRGPPNEIMKDQSHTAEADGP